MEVHFTPEQEARLAEIAITANTDSETLVKDAALRILGEDARFRAPCARALPKPTEVSSLRKKKWTPAAAADLSQINEYFKNRHPRYRQPTIRKLYEAIRSLTDSPG